jgi:hypothetical protein
MLLAELFSLAHTKARDFNHINNLSWGIKQLGRGVDHPPLFRGKVKQIVELYLYTRLGLSGLF